MRQLTLIRHAATDLSGTFCGHINPIVNGHGEEQICELVAALQGRSFTAIYSSDLLRARQTAEPVARGVGAALHLLHDLREIAFGEWEGLRWSEIEARFPEQAQSWMAEYPYRSAPGGEGFAAFQMRVMNCAVRILEELSSSICIVSHGGVIRLMLAKIFNIEEHEAWSLTREHAKAIDLVITEEHLANVDRIWQKNSSGENNEHRDQAW